MRGVFSKDRPRERRTTTRTITESSKAAVHPASASVPERSSHSQSLIPSPILLVLIVGRSSSSTPLAVSKRIRLLSSCFGTGKILSFTKLDSFPNPPRPSSSTPLAVSKRIRLLSSFQCFFSAPNPLTGNGQRPRTSTIKRVLRGSTVYVPQPPPFMNKRWSHYSIGESYWKSIAPDARVLRYSKGRHDHGILIATRTST